MKRPEQTPDDSTDLFERYAKHGLGLERTTGRLRAGDKPAFRRTTTLDRLEKSGHIDGALWTAGDRLATTYELAHGSGGGANYDGIPAPKHAVSRTPPETQMEALGEMAFLHKRMGKIEMADLIAVVCLGQTIEKRAKAFKINYRTMRDRLVRALGNLADIYVK